MYSAALLRETLHGALDLHPSVQLDADTRLAAVLVPVLTAQPEPRLVFTRRTETLSRHAGEISFPGGLADPGETPAEAVLREVSEELGIAGDDVELLGALPSVPTYVSKILIVPFVGLLRMDPRLTPNAAEIADVLEFPLTRLEEVGEERMFEWEGVTFPTHVFDVDGQVIWGATARILRTFFDVLRAPETRRHEP
jgi:8-oxo-dGTP pyrophosphatase MutT (NUDIX family)